MAGVTAQQPVQGGGAGARQTGDEDRALDHDVGVLGVLLPGRFAEQSGHQRVTQEEPRHLAAKFGEIGVAAVGLEKYVEGFAVIVVVGAEVIQPDGLDRRGLQILDRSDVGPACVHALYSPQLTSRVWPVIPLDRSLAMNRIAEATSSSVGRRLRSEFTAAAL